MRTKTPFRRKRLISLGSSSSSSVEVKVERELQCSRCKAIFPDYLARCPECGSEEWIGLVEVNPYTRMPMETFSMSTPLSAMTLAMRTACSISMPPGMNSSML
jgi:hypothetical protein